MLWQPDYDTPGGWQALQPAAPGRITVVSRDALPGRYSRWKPTGNAMRVQAVPGDGTPAGSRSEAYARAAAPMSGTPAEQWPDPPGAVRWYAGSMLVPAGFVFGDGWRWLVCTQWKGYRGGSPPVAVEIKRDRLRLGGTRTNARLIPGDGDLGPITPGAWTRLVVGLHLSTDPAAGWVEVWRDDQLVLPRTAVATMDMVDGSPDPIYFKQGIYRDPGWATPAELHFGPVSIGATRSDVA